MLNHIEQRLNIKLVLLLAGLIFGFSACGTNSSERQNSSSSPLIEDTMVRYPGRTFSYKDKFRDTQAKQVIIKLRVLFLVMPISVQLSIYMFIPTWNIRRNALIKCSNRLNKKMLIGYILYQHSF